jgi:ubiquinone/menaquinone biosynthesis C-methylase UbiE
MTCSCCAFPDTAERQFTQKKAVAEMTRYRRNGPGPTTRLLRDGLITLGLLEGTLLDVGGGVGALSFELLDRGIARAVVVDASAAYLAVASEEAVRRGRSTADFVHGDFITLADQLPPADVVTLDRVVCCYPLYEPLLEEALQHAQRVLAFSYPRGRWYVRVRVWFENALRKRQGHPFRTFVHPASRMQRLVEQAGFELVSRRRTLTWSVDVFLRRRGIPGSRTSTVVRA